jgi:hypothetical protein
MFRRVVAYAAVVCMLASMPLGCYTGREVLAGKSGVPSEYTGYKITTIVTNEGEVIEFSRTAAPEWDPVMTEIVGTPVRRSEARDEGGWSEPKKIPSSERRQCRVGISDVRTVYLEKLSVVKSTLTVVAVTVVVLAVAVGISCANFEPEFDIPADQVTSCPFVYAFDGDYYMLEGVPYVGSMCEALKRTDVLRLEHLVPFEDEYRLQVVNEAIETEYIDEFRLVVADHEPGLELALDARGGVHTIADRQQPLSATDHRGRDWRDWLVERDFLFWEGDPLSMDPEGTADLRDTLFFTFRVPPSAKQAKILVSGGHSLWAAGLELALLDLWGSQVDSLYEEFWDPGHRARFLGWVEREEMVDLAVRVRTSDGWRIADRVSLGGSTGSGECTAILDLDETVGETLEVALAPPAGVWRINSVAVDFSPDVPIEMQEIAASSAVGPDGEDLREVLKANDGAYFVQPETGTSALLAFPVPRRRPGHDRTVFAKTTGYYEIRLDAQGPARTDEIDRLERDPGHAAVFALRQYRERRKGLTALATR